MTELPTGPIGAALPHGGDSAQTSAPTASGGRILPVDAAVARRAAAFHLGLTRPANDARLAGTALVHLLALAT
ncbi:MAG: hypothetical protein LBO20_11430 [Bifidobacteriaceae bacterium]|nr:hypothetical protein [Bifidobacteriaceae bacterium]